MLPQILHQIRQFRNRTNLQAKLALDILHSAVRHIGAVLRRFFLTIQRYHHGVGRGPGRLDDIDRLACGGTRRHDVIDDQHPPLQGCADQAATLAVVFGFLTVVGESGLKKKAFGVYVNTRKNEQVTLGEGDMVVVIATDDGMPAVRPSPSLVAGNVVSG